MKIVTYPAREEWSALVSRPALDKSDLSALVEKVMQAVRDEGDAAVERYGKQFDGVQITAPEVTLEEIEEAKALVSEPLKDAIGLAMHNIEAFHRNQQLTVRKIETMPGVICWQKAVAIDKVGLYVPGGTAPLFSTVLMLTIPARIAGCREIILCTPPNKAGKVHPAILYAASEAGVKRIFKIGGIQAIAAMTYGTATVPKVYKLFGPGNQYVTAAKQWASLRGGVAIDMPAGPSEVEVIADESANPAFVASDLLSQAEHGVDSQVILLTASEKVASRVIEELQRQLAALPRKSIAAQSLEHGRIVVLRNSDEIVEWTNLYAPEHLIIETTDYAELSERIIHAGSVFLGSYTPESAGDYASGTNHTLPTGGYARMYSGVNLDSFVKKITFQEITPQGLRDIGTAIATMAQAESLDGHSKAVTLRIG